MCGGSGTRLWPTSTPDKPKQFISLIGTGSLFQQTVRRVSLLDGFVRLIVVTGAGQAGWVRQQLSGADFEIDIILEPEGRDSAPAIAVAASHVAKLDPEGIAAVVACDHYIPDADHFRREMAKAVAGAERGAIVTLGIRPVEPNSAYGYIRPAKSADQLVQVAAFVEKPDMKTALRYIDDGYVWNSGNFIAKASTLMGELERFAPEVMAAADAALASSISTPDGIRLGPVFTEAPKVSFDYAVMENTDSAMVLKSDLEWSDLGAWDAVHKLSAKDENGNVITGDALVTDSRNCLVRVADGGFAVVSAADDMGVIVEADAVFVSPLDKSQNVKAVVDLLKRGGRLEAGNSLPGLKEDAADLTRWLFTSALPLWWSLGFDRKTGTWCESLDQHGQPTAEHRRARVQGRQSFVYGLAGHMGWAGPWREAVTSGLAGAQEVYGTEDGMLQTLIDRDGQVIDSCCLLYDQTFLLLALAYGRGAVDDAAERAEKLLDAIERRFRRKDGVGFKEADENSYQSNAHMHLFEATIAWIEAGKADGFDTARWSTLAEEIAALALDKFIDPEAGFVREFFDENWHVLGGDKGAILEPGHQFEWAWLYARWSMLDGGPEHIEAARRLFDAGLCGADPSTHAVIDRMDNSLKPVTGRARLWPQTEWLKAALILRALSSGPDRVSYDREARRALDSLKRYLATDIPGLWFDKLTADKGFVVEYAPASTFYHIAGAIDALNRHAGDGAAAE